MNFQKSKIVRAFAGCSLDIFVFREYKSSNLYMNLGLFKFFGSVLDKSTCNTMKLNSISLKIAPHVLNTWNIGTYNGFIKTSDDREAL